MVDTDVRKLALLIEYDGRAYHGFQVQSNALTVQRVLEKVLHTITAENNRLKGGSRTDAGVHALGQVATFTTQSTHPPETFVAALNYHLPPDVAVREAAEVALDFDPRRDASRRRYRYYILNRRSPTPIARGYTLWVRARLDVAAMDRGARELVGERDFASFSGPLPRPQGSTVRHVYRAEVVRHGPSVYFDIEANAFLPQQVRRTMGVLLAIGKGIQGPEAVRTLCDHPSLGAAAATVPPQGLWLMEITYPRGSVSFETSGECASVFPLFMTTAREQGTS